jgi:hypothetical protein
MRGRWSLLYRVHHGSARRRSERARCARRGKHLRRVMGAEAAQSTPTASWFIRKSMRVRVASCVALSSVAAVAISGCFLRGWLVPDTRTPVDRAHELSARCSEADPLPAEALSPSIVERVDGAYVWMHGGVSDITRLRGANLHMRPTVNIPPAVLQRALECHEARVALGEATELPEDPYVLAGSWLDIHVSFSEEGLVASVQTDSFDDAQRVLDRARKFATAAR